MAILQKIMLVENEADIREVACLCLKDLGEFQVTTCESGQEAVDKFPIARPQLVLLDVMMPGMNGLMTFERLRDLPGGRDVPIVFMTARAHPLQMDEYLKKGAAGVIPKPFDPITIVNEISAIWEKFSAAS